MPGAKVPSTSERLLRVPVAKLSNPTTHWPSRNNVSTRCEPMKPAAPVTRKRRGLGPNSELTRSSVSMSEAPVLHVRTRFLAVDCRLQVHEHPAVGERQ